jgi:hypothetical protein
MRQTFRNQIILIHVQRFGRYEFSKGPPKFEILVLIKNDDRYVKTTCINLIHNFSIEFKNKIKLGRFRLCLCFYNFETHSIYTAIFSECAVEA